MATVNTMSTFYKHVIVDIPHTYMRYVCGKNGAHLKKCCKNMGVDSVWFNMKRNVVEIYGPMTNLEKAGGFVQKRMEQIKTKVPHDELEVFRNNVHVNEDAYVIGSLVGALEKEEVKYLIGKKGKHFKKVTKDADVSFIWYDEENHSVLIWGPQEHLSNAVQMLFKRIEFVKSYKKPDDDVVME